MLARNGFRPRGVAVALAMFFAIVAFASASLVVMRVSQDLRTTSLGALQTQRRLAVQGAVNHLLSLLKRGDGAQYTSTSPLVLEIGGIQGIRVWTVPDASVAGALHIRAELSGYSAAKTVISQPEISSRLFYEGGSAGYPGGNTLYTQQPGDPGWTTLPDPPSVAYNSSGQAATLNLLPGGSGQIFDVETNENGQMVVLVVDTVPGSSLGAAHLWDNGSQTWTTLPPLPDFTCDNNGPSLATTFQLPKTSGFSEDKIYSLCPGGLAVYSTTSDAWEYHPPPSTAGQPGLFATAGGGKFAQLMENANDPVSPAWISVFENGGWSNVSLPDPSLTPLGITPEGDLCAAYRLYGQPTTTHMFTSGSWQTAGTPTALDGMRLEAVDGEGNLIYSGPGLDLKVWEPKSGSVESTTLPSGFTLTHQGSRLLAGGGQPTGGQSGLEVVSSY